MDNSLPFVSVIVPARNEEAYISDCLRSILEGTYPRDRLEVLVIDGQSADQTRQIASTFSQKYSEVRVFENHARIVPNAMNIGIRAARGDIIVRMDAHARYPPDYVMKLVTWMEKLNADNVGGQWITMPARDSLEAASIALILGHWFGVGTALYRIGTGNSPVEVDTVPFGCYRRETFRRIGLYDERFVRNQDDELNARLKKAGGRIYLIPEIRIEYVARESLGKMARMLYQYGYFKPLIAFKLGRPATWRQLAPPMFVASLVVFSVGTFLSPTIGLLGCAVLGSHSIVNLGVSTAIAARKGWRVLPYLFCGFLLAHIAYGTGYLRGMLDFGLLRRRFSREGNDAPLSR